MNWYIYKVYYFIKPIDVYIIKNSTSLHYNKKKNIGALSAYMRYVHIYVHIECTRTQRYGHTKVYS